MALFQATLCSSASSVPDSFSPRSVYCGQAQVLPKAGVPQTPGCSFFSGVRTFNGSKLAAFGCSKYPSRQLLIVTASSSHSSHSDGDVPKDPKIGEGQFSTKIHAVFEAKEEASYSSLDIGAVSDAPSMPINSGILEKVHKFPGRYVFKAVGSGGMDFVEGLVARVGEVLGRDLVYEQDWYWRSSTQKKYQSVTVKVIVTSVDQIYKVYAAMKKDPRVRFLL
eukprot:CAMPEP_0196652380 /NCGR_PEP_ID=MMETSP1086-20130531/1653_1 /TAXON_ID=77921 /ORGANISM="Cyanoptyche  gloeocystis , Strain SAG4.97" /LENGTH=221 /DNA_ID=CAMNT_0041982893 /DNA_START=32 /DNA_END=697 /DNA_ORIENTATION=+